jgi:hypothetical protein
MSIAAQISGPAATATATGVGAAGTTIAEDLPPTIIIPVGLKFDNTLGALFIGCILGTLSVLYPHHFALISALKFNRLYGVNCVQFEIYLTSNRTKMDSWMMKAFTIALL